MNGKFIDDDDDNELLSGLDVPEDLLNDLNGAALEPSEVLSALDKLHEGALESENAKLRMSDLEGMEVLELPSTGQVAAVIESYITRTSSEFRETGCGEALMVVRWRWAPVVPADVDNFISSMRTGISRLRARAVKGRPFYFVVREYKIAEDRKTVLFDFARMGPAQYRAYRKETKGGWTKRTRDPAAPMSRALNMLENE